MAKRNFLGPHGTVLGLAEFWLLTLGGFVLFFGTWTLVAWSGLLPANLLPSPSAVWTTLLRLWNHPFAGHVYADHMLASLGRFLMGWALAVAVGTVQSPFDAQVCSRMRPCVAANSASL